MMHRSAVSRAFALGVVLATAIALGGCTAQGSGGGDPDDPLQQYAGATLRVAAEDNDSTTTIMQLLPEFEEATGITVEMEVLDETSLRQKLVLDFTSGSGAYDVGELQYWFVPEFAKAGHLEPLEPLLATTGVDQWLDIDDFPGSTLESMKFEGELYGLPVRLIAGMLYYRDDLIDSRPTTVDEVMDLVRDSADEFEDAGAVGWTGRGNRDFSSFGSFGGWAAAYGARLFDDEFRPTLTSDPAWKQALSDWVELMRDNSAPGAGNMSWYEAYQQFQSGGAALMFETSDYGALFEDPAESAVVGKVGYAPPPAGPSGATAQWFFAGGYSINADISEEQKAAASLFVQWRSSKDVFAQELTVDDAPRFTIPSTTVLESQEFEDAATAAGLEEYVLAQREAFLAMDPSYWPLIPEFIEVASAYAANVSAAIAGQMSVDQALEDSDSAIEAIMEEAGYYS